MMKLKRHSYYLLPYNEKNIRKFKSSDNMLKHARCNSDTSGWFFVNRKSGDMVGYIGWENDVVIALEVSKEYEGKRYASRLLKLA